MERNHYDYDRSCLYWVRHLLHIKTSHGRNEQGLTYVKK